jgi:hypothetical protein
MYIRSCTGCGRTFETEDFRRQKCQKNCQRSSASANAARLARREAHAVDFIGVDGEGVTRADGRHDYVMLSVGQDTLTRPDGGPLNHEEIFAFLWNCYRKNPNAAYVGYFLGYDFTKWLRSLPEDRARMLFTKEGIAKRRRTSSGGNPTPFPVYVGPWELDMLGMRRFKLRPAGGSKRRSWLTICDAGSFFQTSFLNAIDPKRWGTSLVDPADHALITEGKQRRAVAQLDEKMTAYNLAENRALSALMTQLNDGFTAAGVRLQRSQWFGPGQAAQAWLNSAKAPTSEQIYAIVPAWAIDAARATYFGGWFEIMAHGLIPGPTYEYDLNSAYPWVMSTLPCLLHGTWTQGKGKAPGTVRRTGGSTALLARYATVSGNDPHIGAMLHRVSSSQILRPGKTKGWFWDHELKAARRAGLINQIETHSWVHYAPCDCPPPLAAIADLYQLRLSVGKNTAAGIAMKLIYNSMYGKFAQSVGSPKYANPVYASLITAGCRTAILDAIATHPRKSAAVVMVATDGVYFTSEHPTLDLDDARLGAWSRSTKQNLSLFKPGVYWDDSARRLLAAGKSPKLRSRGISARDLGAEVTRIDQMWADFETSWTSQQPDDGFAWPHVDVTVNFSITSPALALSRGKWKTCGQVTTDDTVSQSADPSMKRSTRILDFDSGYIRTQPHSRCKVLESTPYEGTFGEQIQEMFDFANITKELAPGKDIYEILTLELGDDEELEIIEL